MYNRIATLASSMSQMYHLNNTKTKMYETSRQVSTQQKSVNYAGISQDSSRLLAIENLTSAHQNFIKKNKLLDARMKMAGIAYESVEKSTHTMLNKLIEFSEGTPKNESEVKLVQQMAFDALRLVASYLNSAADGRYLFSGTKVDTPPVEFNEATLEDFQRKYDGFRVAYPETRDAHLTDLTLSSDTDGVEDWLIFNQADNTITANTGSFANFAPGATITVSGTASNNGTYVIGSISDDATTITLTSPFVSSDNDQGLTITYNNEADLDTDDFGSISFTAPNRLVAADPDALSRIKVGDIIEITGASARTNNGGYRVIGNSVANGLTVAMVSLTDESTPPTVPGDPVTGVPGTISAVSWYKGDTNTTKQQVDFDLDLDVDVTAIHPAFEKAIRAFGMIAQGRFGTAGSIEHNNDRIDKARFLLHSAIDGISMGDDELYYSEESGDLVELNYDIAFKRTLIMDTEERFVAFDAVLVDQQADIENVDLTETMTQLMEQRRGLEAAYNVYSKIQQLTLSDFLR